MLSLFNQLPPFLCAAVARVGVRRKTLVEISKESGLAYRKVERLSRAECWDRIKVEDACAFSEACGVDLINQSSTRKYLRRQQSVKNVLSHLTADQLKKVTERMSRIKAPASPAPCA
jgi:hypothetical protein